MHLFLQGGNAVTAALSGITYRVKKNENNFKKKVCRKENDTYLCSPLNRVGSIAQLVQSICLTSRGSAVRTRVLPHNKQ
jgi:hypothetical protein